ncbi:MAG: SAM-dependent methyltransferase, partial [Gammaproteobacteria bacterium]|nr:SAM-dependent methyltransferase [Pseudomonadales bacterium]NIP71527.1 SAM-dependent methyltransferase [Gammaproteobacteria bacterium]NIX06945.1 SAM-dependent methyltransferase [Pseudomonadales bacterium]
SLEWFAGRLAALKEKGPPPLGFHLLLGNLAPVSLENNLRN